MVKVNDVITVEMVTKTVIRNGKEVETKGGKIEENGSALKMVTNYGNKLEMKWERG